MYYFQVVEEILHLSIEGSYCLLSEPHCLVFLELFLLFLR